MPHTKLTLMGVLVVKHFKTYEGLRFSFFFPSKEKICDKSLHRLHKYIRINLKISS